MKLLLDTHALIWWSLDHPHLPKRMHALLEDLDTEVFVSSASIWEVAIKFAADKLPEAEIFLADLRTGKALGSFKELPITGNHAVQAGLLAIDHKNPFDCMLIAQALLEGMTLVSNERIFDRFGVSRIWK